MQKWSKTQLISSLQKQGLHFQEFSLTHEGEYTTEDADWNYKDVPHLHHIHHLVEATAAIIEDDLIASITVQKVLGIKMPLAVVNYESGKNEQTYYTTSFFFALIILTRYEKISESRTRVITTYSVGSSRWLEWCFPFLRFLIKRNYKDLMSGDIPMRERRGQLRKWGYTFYKEGESYSFPKTMEILKSNVIPPLGEPRQTTIVINQVLPRDGEYFHGRDDHFGMRLVSQKGELTIFPRLCPHEGASLDHGMCVDKKVKCPWHGRLHAPLATFDLNDTNNQTIKTAKFKFSLSNNILTVLEVGTIAELLETLGS